MKAVTGPAPRAAEAALGWLKATWRPVHAGEALLVSGALALTEIARAVEPRASQLADELWAMLMPAVTPEALVTPDVLTALLASAAILRDARRPVDVLKYLRLLGEQHRIRHDADAAAVRVALYGSRLAQGSGMLPPARMLRLGRDEDTRLALAGVESASAYGAVAMPADPVLTALLEGTAMRALRQYDLPLGMRALRAKVYIGVPGSLGTETGAEFLRLAAADDGSFGDYDTLLRAMRAVPRDPAWLAIKLPITAQAVWTLAELLDPGFRLLPHAFGDGLLPYQQEGRPVLNDPR